MRFLGHYLLVAILFVVLDAIWLKSTSRFYQKHIGELLAKKPRMVPAVAFYLLYMVGIVVFALNPALGAHSLSYAISHGALLGFLMFVTYDLTNQATLKTWSSTITGVDLLWGTFSTTLVTTIAFLILK